MVEPTHCPKSGKLRYPSKRTARRLLSYKARHGDRSYAAMHAYRCPHCKAWHVGHGRAA